MKFYILEILSNINMHKEKLSYLWLAFIILLVGYYNTSADYMLKIQKQKTYNIDYANEQIKISNETLSNLRLEESKLVNAISIYQECVKLNTVKDLPVSCEDITIDIQWELKWLVNKDGKSQSYITLIWDTPKARAEYLLSKYPAVAWHINTFIELWVKYKIDPYLVIAIAKADSSLGNELLTTNNIGNVGNNDRWDKVEFATIEHWIEAIYKTLNNKYLGNIYTVWYLSCWGKINLWLKDCFQNWEKVYATSDSSWNVNVINTLRNLYKDSSIDEEFNFRI